MTIAICGDIGGTNANLCIAELNDTISIKNVVKEPTKGYNSFIEIIDRYREKTNITPSAACFAVAGPVKNQRVEMTNTNIVVDAKEIQEKTGINTVLIINDFEAIGYATNILEDDEVRVVNTGTPQKYATRAAIGAGTGLGKNILIYDDRKDAYLPHPSEGGHVDFPIHNQNEWELTQFIAKMNKVKHAVVYEHLLSGRGLRSIYSSLQKKKYPEEEPDLSSKEISRRRSSSPCCKETFETFITFYARCAKNFTLDTLAIGGIFIAGGIAAANHDMFGEAFLREYLAHYDPRFTEILKNTPIHIITNYGVSLKGAAYALRIQGS